VKNLVDLSHTVMMATVIIKVLVWDLEGLGWEMLGHGLVSQVRVATVMPADLEELEKAFKLFLVLRTWHSVVRHEGLFHSRCQKDHTSILHQ